MMTNREKSDFISEIPRLLRRKRNIPCTQSTDTMTFGRPLLETSGDDSVSEQHMIGSHRKDSTNPEIVPVEEKNYNILYLFTGNCASSWITRRQITVSDRKFPKVVVSRNNNKHYIVVVGDMESNEEDECMIPGMETEVPGRPDQDVEYEFSSTIQRSILKQNDRSAMSIGAQRGTKRRMETTCDDTDNEIAIPENGENGDGEDYNDIQKRKKRARMCIYNWNFQSQASHNKNNNKTSMAEVTENESENNCETDKTVVVEMAISGVEEVCPTTGDGDEASLPYTNHVTVKQQSPLEHIVFLEKILIENWQNKGILNSYHRSAVKMFRHPVEKMDTSDQMNEFLIIIQISSCQTTYSPQITARIFTQIKDINENGNLQEQVPPYTTKPKEIVRKKLILKGSMGNDKNAICNSIFQTWCCVQNTQQNTGSGDLRIPSAILVRDFVVICSTCNSFFFIDQAMVNYQEDLNVYRYTISGIKGRDQQNKSLHGTAEKILIFDGQSEIVSDTFDFAKYITISSDVFDVFEKVWTCHLEHEIHSDVFYQTGLVFGDLCKSDRRRIRCAGEDELTSLPLINGQFVKAISLQRFKILKVQDLSYYVSLKSKLKTRISRTNSRLVENIFSIDKQCLDVSTSASGKPFLKDKNEHKTIVDGNHFEDGVHTLVKTFFKVIDTTVLLREDGSKSEPQKQSCEDTMTQQGKRSDEFNKSDVGEIDLKEKKKTFELYHRIWLPYNQRPLPCLSREEIIGFFEGKTLYTPPTEHVKYREILTQLASDNIPGPQITMKYEMLRLCTMKSFPRGERPFAIRIIAAGFYYAGYRDQVICYCCGNRKDNWVIGDIPLLIHQKMAPNCPFLTNNSAVSIPIRTANSAQSPADVRLLALQRFAGATQSDTAQIESSLMLPSGEQSQVNISNGTLQMLVTNNDSPPNNPMSSGGQNILANRQTIVAIADSVEEPPPKYPQYAVKNMRINSFHGWPAELHQRPEEMAECGFYYAGFNDCVRCFYCGVGLRDWMSEDDPWIEHARWSTSCIYVYKMKGEEFVSLVKMAVEIAEREEAARGNGVRNQTPQSNTKAALTNEDFHGNIDTNSTALRDLTSNPRVVGGAAGGATASTPYPGNADIQKYLLTDAAQSVLDMGYQPKLVQQAIERALNQGTEKLTGLIIMEAVFEIEEDDKAKQRPQPSSQSAESNRSDAKEILHQNVLKRCLTDLVKDLDFKTVILYIQQKEIFDDVIMRDILEQKTTNDKTRELIKQIQHRGQETYETFKECLVQAKQAFLKDLLEEEEAAISNEIKEKLKAENKANDKDAANCTEGRKQDGLAGEIEGASGDDKQIDAEKIKREHRELCEATRCKICLVNTISVVFLPCGHLVTCPDCAPAMRKCPICRALIKGTVKTFYG